MLPLKRKCRVCGHLMDYQSYASRAADTLIIQYKCPECGAIAKETALMGLMQDNLTFLEKLSALNNEERELPWPDL